VKCPILQASTSEVYGDPSMHPQTEAYWGNVNPIGPRACYDEGKRCAETLFFDYLRQHSVAIKVMRIFNTYGPRMHENDGRVVSNFIIRALRGQPISIYGTGTQTRSFCYVDDLIEAAVRFMSTPADVTGPINVGNPVECTILDLAKQIIEMIGSSSPIIFHLASQDDPKQRRPDISLADRCSIGNRGSCSAKVSKRPSRILSSNCAIDGATIGPLNVRSSGARLFFFAVLLRDWR
jgi:UDP-glucuronate decarboxylase